MATDAIQSSATNDALTNFDSSPAAAHVRLPVVRALFGCSSATVWRMVKRGTLPAPRKLSERVTAWNVGDLRASLAGSK
jgi:predicted DNA-binding transcriptional regulator AlpA